MKINEIFYSLQGEGKWTGFPNIFIRTSTCNLRCSFCDTTYAYEDGKEMKILEIIDEIKKYKCKKICITGGEPLVQKETINLIKNLVEKKYEICIETNGSIKIDEISKIKNILISLDIKCPSSDMDKKMNFENIKLLRENDQLKFVINNYNDYLYSKEIFEKYIPRCTVFFQPVWKTDSKKLAEWIIKDNLDVKLGLQIHKIIDLK